MIEEADDALLERWRAGDPEAASALFERHFDALYRFFRNKAEAVADDLVQRTMLACFEARDRFRGDSSFRTYLFSIARNQLLTHLTRGRQAGTPIDPDRESIADGAPSPSSAVGRRREQALVLAALRRLPIDHQILVELFYWEDLSAREMGEVLGAPEGTIRTRLRKARALLAEHIDALAGDPGLAHSTISRRDDWAAGLVRDTEPGDD
jgi:RNA polymerase sigma factor (sigma-70 family)